jgi:4'-phosphopantetheinyl transferase EntD
MEELLQDALGDHSLRIWTSPHWGAENPQHRELIYSQLDQKMAGQKLYSSISHNQKIGGFAVSQYPVGFDIEESSRVSEAVIKRISTPEELKKAPDFASLWCAKEASFKALKNFEQPTTISQVEIEFEKSSASPLFRFRIQNEKKFNASPGKGLSWKESSQTYCVIVFNI